MQIIDKKVPKDFFSQRGRPHRGGKEVRCFNIGYLFLQKIYHELGPDHFTTEQIIDRLKEMNMLSVESEGYVPNYERTRITNALHGTAGFRTDMQIVTKKSMRPFSKQDSLPYRQTQNTNQNSEKRHRKRAVTLHIEKIENAPK